RPHAPLPTRRSSDLLPLFKLLKRADRFDWNQEAEQALQGLKEYLSSPPVLTAPLPGEPLLLYVAATPVVVSAVIVTERDREDSRSEEHTSELQSPDH